MRSAILFLAAAAGALAAAPSCAADNCARALTGTQAGASRSASRVSTDCAAFQQVTFYPAAVTTTTTSGSTSTTISPAFASTTITPVAVPAYALTACSSGAMAASRFSSACSCAGVTQTVAQAPTPTVTVVVPTAAIRYCDNPQSYCSGTSGSGAGCICFQLKDDTRGACFDMPIADPCGPPCSSNADCVAADRICISAGCGDNCVPAEAARLCANPSAPSKLFRKRAPAPAAGTHNYVGPSQ